MLLCSQVRADFAVQMEEWNSIGCDGCDVGDLWAQGVGGGSATAGRRDATFTDDIAQKLFHFLDCHRLRELLSCMNLAS